jgi:tripartite-type tricarboxylate transporter receptor subunit TctC
MVKAQAACAAVVAAAAILFAAQPAAAQPTVADFYKGKTVTILMGTGPGASYDAYGRTIAEHLGRHIPGNPKLNVEHMPGAGGVVAGNHIYGPAPQDGTRILLAHALPLIERMSPKGVQYESRKMQWLGSYDAIAQMMAIWHDAGVTTFDEFKNKEFVVGSFNKTHFSYQWAMLTKLILQTKYRVTTGYPSGNHLNLAMERGEIAGWTASWESIAAGRPQWLAEKKVYFPVQYTLERMHDLPDVPTLIELAPPEQRALPEFIASGTPFARAMAVGPRVPSDRVAALRKAFDDLMVDKEFLALAAKRKLDIHPRNAAATNALLEKVVGASPQFVAQVMKAVE